MGDTFIPHQSFRFQIAEIFSNIRQLPEIQLMPNRSLSNSLKIFLKSATWLTDEDAAMVAACKVMAASLDAELATGDLTPSLMSQYTMSINRLRALKPKPKPVEPPKPVDPLEALLNTDAPPLNSMTHMSE